VWGPLFGRTCSNVPQPVPAYVQYAEQQGFLGEEIELLQNFAAVQKSDLLAAMESWTRKATDVIAGARNQLQFGDECRPYLMARQSLLEGRGAANKLEDLVVEAAVVTFQTKWNEKVRFFVFLGFFLLLNPHFEYNL